MGLLDGMLGGGGGDRGAPGLGSTVIAGVALALLIKAVKAHGSGATAAAQGGPASGGLGQDGGQAPGQGGGLGSILGGLGGLLGGGGQAGGGGLGGLLSGGAGGGLGSLLTGLGGAGGLGALVGQMQKSGFGDHAQSWIGPGRNRAIDPNELAQALGEPAIGQLQQRTGMSREALLATLSHELPDAVSQATPDGRLPTDGELSRIAGAG